MSGEKRGREDDKEADAHDDKRDPKHLVKPGYVRDLPFRLVKEHEWSERASIVEIAGFVADQTSATHTFVGTRLFNPHLAPGASIEELQYWTNSGVDATASLDEKDDPSVMVTALHPLLCLGRDVKVKMPLALETVNALTMHTELARVPQYTISLMMTMLIHKHGTHAADPLSVDAADAWQRIAVPDGMPPFNERLLSLLWQCVAQSPMYRLYATLAVADPESPFHEVTDDFLYDKRVLTAALIRAAIDTVPEQPGPRAEELDEAPFDFANMQ